MEVRDFLEAVFQEDDGYLMSWFYHRATGKKKEAGFELRKNGIASLLHNAEQASARGWDCYYAPAVFKGPKRTKESFSHSNVLWADFDSGNGLPDFETAPSLVVQSSPGKYHVYWNLHNEIKDYSTLESLNKGIAYAFGADKGGWDCVQLLRVPGTMNYKTEYGTPQPVMLEQLNMVSYPIDKFSGFLVGNLTRNLAMALHPSAQS